MFMVVRTTCGELSCRCGTDRLIFSHIAPDRRPVAKLRWGISKRIGQSDFGQGNPKLKAGFILPSEGTQEALNH